MAGISKISAFTRWCFGDATTLSSAMPAGIRNVLSPIWARRCARLGSILESQSSSITWAFIRVRKSARSKIPGTTARLVEIAIRELQDAWRAHDGETLHKLRRRLSVFYSRNPRASLADEITGLACRIARIIGK